MDNQNQNSIHPHCKAHTNTKGGEEEEELLVNENLQQTVKPTFREEKFLVKCNGCSCAESC